MGTQALGSAAPTHPSCITGVFPVHFLRRVYCFSVLGSGAGRGTRWLTGHTLVSQTGHRGEPWAWLHWDAGHGIREAQNGLGWKEC